MLKTGTGLWGFSWPIPLRLETSHSLAHESLTYAILTMRLVLSSERICPIPSLSTLGETYRERTKGPLRRCLFTGKGRKLVAGSPGTPKTLVQEFERSSGELFGVNSYKETLHFVNRRPGFLLGRFLGFRFRMILCNIESLFGPQLTSTKSGLLWLAFGHLSASLWPPWGR